MSLTYRPDIDGLRSVAILPVVLYHAGFASFSGGYVGVDVFFVISGFLITSIIYPKIVQGSFTLADFYEKRIRRLFPALFTVLLFTILPSFFLLMPQEFEDFGQSLASTALFSANFMFYSEAGYFEGSAELKPLLHSWSLAIEEQYYLLFPGLLIFLVKRQALRVKACVFLLFIGSLLLSIWSTTNAPTAGFYLLPSRAWELLLGSLLALSLVPSIKSKALNQALSTTGLILILLAIFAFDAETPFPGLAAVLPCLGTALIIYAGGDSSKTLITRILSVKPLVFIGMISYSLYLWHWPLFAFAKNYLVRDLHTTEAALIILASFICAYLSWRFIEQPFRGRNALFKRKTLFQYTGVCMALYIAMGLTFDSTNGLPGRLPADVLEIVQVAQDKPVDRKTCEGIKPERVSFERLCRINDQNVPPSFILWGDSHAAVLVKPLREITKHIGVNGINATSNGCVPLVNATRTGRDPEQECIAYFNKVYTLVEEHPEISTIILSARWGFYANGTRYQSENGGPLFLAYKGQQVDNPDDNRELFSEAFRDTLTFLSQLNREIVIVGPVPEIGIDVPNTLAKARLHDRQISISTNFQDFLERNAPVFALFDEFTNKQNTHILPIHQNLCNKYRCLAEEQGFPLYFDDNHLASGGTVKIAGTLAKIFR